MEQHKQPAPILKKPTMELEMPTVSMYEQIEPSQVHPNPGSHIETYHHINISSDSNSDTQKKQEEHHVQFADASPDNSAHSFSSEIIREADLEADASESNFLEHVRKKKKAAPKRKKKKPNNPKNLIFLSYFFYFISLPLAFLFIIYLSICLSIDFNHFNSQSPKNFIPIET